LPDTAGNLLTCCIEGIRCINSYAAPNRQQSHAESFLETFVAHKLEQVPWLAAEDHNENPQDATHVGVVLGPGRPTRREGQSEINWCMSNSPSLFGNPEQLTDYDISDDIASSAPAQPKIAPAQHCRLAPQPRWTKPSRH
jgi:hypothetical protein